MKTSIFDMNFVLPPVAVMTEVVKEMPFFFTDKVTVFIVPC
jgi:hypothetical protein